MLSRGPKYVPKCQSYFSAQFTVDDIIEREYRRMSTVITKCLTANCVSATDGRATLFMVSLKNLLRHLYTTRLPKKLACRAQQEYLLTKQIRHLVRAPCNRLVLRRTDKSKVFHLGSKDDYEAKAIAYMQKTCAYEEVKDGKCPLADNLSFVVTLLDRLLISKAISHQQWSAMMPKKDKIELGHLYFLPKPHKVRS
jgi:hypothetical protein